MSTTSNKFRVTIWQRRLRVSGLLCLWLASTVGPLHAADDGLRFVKALRGAGYHDTARDYLEQFASQHALPPSLAETYDYELALTLLELAGATLNAETREDYWDEADQALDRFVSQADESLAAARARQARAQLQWDRARTLLRQAATESNPSNLQTLSELRARAQASLDEAAVLAEQVERFYVDALADKQRFPPGVSPDRDPATAALRRSYWSGQIEAEILRVRLLKESAQTKADGSAERKRALQEASKQFGELAEKYRIYTAGLVARLEQGRCQQALGEHKKALAYFQEIVDQPTEERVFRQLITLAHRHIAESSAALGRHREGLSRCSSWLTQARTEERRRPEWLALKYHTALVAHALAAQATTAQERGALHRQALGWLSDVRSRPGEFRLAAAELFATISGNTGGTKQQPALFEEAFERASNAMQNYRQQEEIQARSTNPDATPQIATQLQSARHEAQLVLEQAVAHPQAREHPQQFYRLQYWRGYIAYHRQRFREAALLGEYLFGRIPQDPLAKDASQLALASYLALFRSAPPQQRSYEFDVLASLATRVADQYPESPAGSAAIALLLDLCQDAAIDLDQSRAGLRRANTWLERLPPTSSLRQEMLLKVGLAQWQLWLREESTRDAAALTETRSALSEGLAQLPTAAPITPAIRAAALARLQLELHSGNYAEAVDALEHATWGPLALLKRSPTSATADDFAVRTFEVAVSAYSLTDPPQPQRAREMLAALAAQAAGAGSRAQLFLRLAVQLRERQAQLLQAGQLTAANSMTDSLELLLEELVEQQSALDWSAQLWVAHTFFTLGDGLAESPTNASQLKRLEQAAQRYASLLDAATANSDPPEANALLGLRLRLAACLRQLHRSEEALEQLLEVLRAKPLNLAAQIEAARTLEQMAADATAPVQAREAYRQAMTGAVPNQAGKKLIWGWRQIAQRTRQRDDLQQEFHAANFHHIACRFGYGKSQADGAVSRKYYTLAWKDIRAMRRIYPELGGPQLRAQYDELLKEVQAALQKQPVGLSEFEQTGNENTS